MGQGAYIFGCEGLELLDAEKAFFRAADPWGFILFARNIDTPAQIAGLTDALRETVGRDAPVLIDQEGGRVARLTPPTWRGWPAPLEQVARSGKRAARSMYLRYRLIADELRALGIDTNCAPCADIAEPATHPVLRNRCYGATRERVIEVSRAVADGLLAGGVLPVVKHMPGHGRATVDSHLGLPRVTAPGEELSDTDFAVFRALSDLPLGMSAHVVYEDIDPQAPATTSPVMVRLIREEIGFDGLLMTDDLSMQALAGSVTRRSRAALGAGLDMILHCNGELAEMEAVAAEAGTMSAAAQARADAALDRRNSPDPVDIGALEAELAGLLDRQADG